MEPLIFSCNWGDQPEKAWSGTSLGLYQELQKYYEMEDLKINPKIPPLFLFRCMEKLGLGRFDMVYMKYFSSIFTKKYQGRKDCKVFQMDECPNVSWAKSYVFQDLSIGFLLDVYQKKPELIPYVGLENLSERYLKNRIEKQQEFYQHAAGIFTMGQWLADYLVEESGIPRAKVHAVGGGINVDPSKIDHSEKKGNKILFVGRDFHRKGGDLVVEAFQILRERKPQAELYIAGPKNNPISNQNKTDGIYFCGEESKEQLIGLYNKCDVFCMPSKFEAYGLVFPEALSYGLPCIGRNAFSMKEFIQPGENGYLIEDDDPEVLADIMSKALENTEMQQYTIGQRDFYIKEYSWESVVRRIIKVMNGPEKEGKSRCKMGNPKVSVVIPVYNGEQYIETCMKTMAEQTYSNLEIIVVDDGSKDGTGPLCDEYGAKDARLKVIHQENKGLSGARNTGIRNATGKYVLFVDVDDTMEPNTVKDNVELAETYNADIVMFCFWYYYVDKKRLIPNEMKKLFVGSDEDYFRHMLIPTMDQEVFNAPWNKLIRRSVLVDYNITFNEKYPIYEDIIFAPLVLKACKKVVINNKMYYKYFCKSSGSLISGFYERFFQSVSQYYRNAMEYCSNYPNHEQQKSRMSRLYCELTIMHIKQIACNRKLTTSKRMEMLKTIFEDSQFLEALGNAKLKKRKWIVCALIKGQQYHICIIFYQILEKIQQMKK